MVPILLKDGLNLMDIKNIGHAIRLAVKDELSRELSFGCVNYKSQGSHKDMDYEDFVISSNVIIKSIEDTNWNEIETFEHLRSRGLVIEEEMFAATGGINTYKGLIFLVIILVYGLIKTKNFDEASFFIREFSKPILNDYKLFKKARDCRNLGIKDVRTFPLSGFEEIFKLSIDFEKLGMTDEILTLFLISRIDDTTTFARSSLDELRSLQKKALILYEDYCSGVDIGQKLKDLSDYYVDNNISSGGVADIFILTKTIYYLRRLYE